MISNKLITWLNDNELSSEQFMLLYLISQSKQDEQINSEFSRYVEINASKFNYRDLIENLESLGFLENFNKKNEFELDKINVTNKFTDKLFIHIDKAFEEVWNLYPKRIRSMNGNSFSPTFGNKEKAKLLYQQFTENRKDKHYEFVFIVEKYLIGKEDGRFLYKFENLLENYDGIKAGVEEAVQDDDTHDYEVM